MAKSIQNISMDYLGGTAGVHCQAVTLRDEYDYTKDKAVIIADESAYVTGTGTIVTTGTAVVGTGTDFDPEVIVGDYLIAVDATAGKGNEARKVISIADDTNLVIESAFSTDISGKAVIVAKAKGRSTIQTFTDRAAFIGLSSHIAGPLTTADQLLLAE